MRARLFTLAIVIWCVAFGTYLLLACTISLSELLTAFAVAVLAVLWAHLIRSNSRRRFSAGREQIVPGLRAFAGLFPATLRTAAILGKVAIRGGSPGCLVRSRFEFGRSENPRQRTRRALAVLCASLAPDRFVVAVERRRSEALIHAIDDSRGETDPEWLQ